MDKRLGSDTGPEESLMIINVEKTAPVSTGLRTETELGMISNADISTTSSVKRWLDQPLKSRDFKRSSTSSTRRE